MASRPPSDSPVGAGHDVDPGSEGRRRVPAGGWLADLTQDLRFTARALSRSPGFAVVTALTVALGLAATTTVFSLMNAFLLRPLPVAAPERLFALEESRTGAGFTDYGYSAVPYARFLAYEEGTRDVFAGLAAQRFTIVSLRAGEEAAAVSGVLASRNYFAVLGLRPAAGRFFETGDEPAAVLSHRLWRERFGGAAAAVGRTVYIDSRPYTVVGVAPRGFGGTLAVSAADVWVPIRAHRSAAAGAAADPWVFAFGRLRPGLEPGQAAAAVDAAAKRIPPEAPNVEVRGAALDPLTGLSPEWRPVLRTFLAVMLATAVLVLLIAAANIAGMLLARAVARRREVAIRLALGAGRGRLVRQLLTETVVLFLLGAVPGLVLTVLALDFVVQQIQVPLGVPVPLNAELDLRVLAFALASCAGTGIVFGLAPAFQAARPELVPALKSSGWSHGVLGTRGRSGFVAAQVAAAVLLLVTAGLFVRALGRGLAADLGFDPDGVVVARIDLRTHGFDEERARAFYGRLVERLRAAPGVAGVGLARLPLVTGTTHSRTVASVDDGTAGSTESQALHNWVDPGYFATMRVPLVAGRAFTDEDRAGGPPVVVVNETLARRLWPGESPLGKLLRTGGRQHEVVGVARDGKYWLVGERPMAFAYHPVAQAFDPTLVLHVRTRTGAAAAIEAIRREVRALDPNVAPERALPLRVMVGMSLLPQRFGALLVGAFGLLGLVLAAIGVYGVLAFQVAQRVREIGIRIALGATARGVLGLVLRRGVTLAAAGMAAGVAMAAAAAPFLERLLFEGLLFGVSPLDPVTFLGVPALLLVVAFLASYLPARRATRVSPLEALREE